MAAAVAAATTAAVGVERMGFPRYDVTFARFSRQYPQDVNVYYHARDVDEFIDFLATPIEGYFRIVVKSLQTRSSDFECVILISRNKAGEWQINFTNCGLSLTVPHDDSFHSGFPLLSCFYECVTSRMVRYMEVIAKSNFPT